MDIRLCEVPVSFTAADLKSAIRPKILELAHGTDFDFAIKLEYTYETAYWDALSAFFRTYSALIIIPSPEVATAFLNINTGKIEKVSVDHPNPSIKEKYVILPQRVILQTTQAEEYQALLRSPYKPQVVPPLNTPLSGNIRKFDTLQCGWFNEKSAFDTAATWKPTAPLDWLAWYGDSFPRKFELGVSYEAVGNHWTGEWVDFRIQDMSHIIVTQPKMDSGAAPQPNITELYFIMNSPPRFYSREITIPQQTNINLIQDSTASKKDLPNTSGRGIPCDFRISYLNSKMRTDWEPNWQIQYSRVWRINLIGDSPFTFNTLVNILADEIKQNKIKVRLLSGIDSSKSVNYPAVKQAFETIYRTLSLPTLDTVVALRIHRLVLNGHYTPLQFSASLPDIINALNAIPSRNRQVQFLDYVAQEIRPKAHLRQAADLLLEEGNRTLLTIPRLVDGFNTLNPVNDAEKPEDSDILPLRLIVYPSHMELKPAETLDARASNRVLRKYDYIKDSFLRACFLDNDEGPLKNDDFEVNVDRLIGSQIVSRLKTKISVGGRDFQFLAFSNSSLKEERQVYFFTNTKGITAEEIRKEIGDWARPDAKDLMQSPCKWAARMGQAFSNTVVATALKKDEWSVMADVKTIDNNYTFTDGIGIISQELVREINTGLRDRYGEESIAVAFQIRFAGAKGVVCLAADKFFAPGEKMRLRESMVKFHVPGEDQPQDLEICLGGGARAYSNASFNKPLIKLLEGLYSRETEENKKKKLDLVQKIFADDVAQDAMMDPKYFERYMKGPFDIQALLLSVKDVPWDAKKNSILHLITARLLRKVRLEEKFSFKIPIPYSYICLGIIDEYKILEEGQIYVRSKGQTISGRVMIYRNPVIHPGDVQIAEAMSDEKLKDKLKGGAETLRMLDNIVAFSMKNNAMQPLQTRLSGGDLDGDLYCIIHEASGILPSPGIATFDSANYLAQAPFKLQPPRPSTIDDVAEFVGNFVHFDCVGRLSTLLLTISDLMPDGLQNESCKRLSNLISNAVDFQKNGNPVNFDELSTNPIFAPPRVPDFNRQFVMRKFDDPTGRFYKSPKLLGQIFRSMPDTPLQDFPVDNKNLLVAVYDRWGPKSIPTKAAQQIIADLVKKSRIRLWRIYQGFPPGKTEADLFLDWMDTRRGTRMSRESTQMKLANLIDELKWKTIWACQFAADINKIDERYGLKYTLWLHTAKELAEIPEGPVPAGFGVTLSLVALEFLNYDDFPREKKLRLGYAGGR